MAEEASSGPASLPECIGDFEILHELGRGGMGIVCAVRQKSLDRRVALKLVLDGRLAGSQARDRFLREAEAAARLNHPNIIPIYQVGEADGFLYYSMRLLEGGSLADHLAAYELTSPDGKPTDSRTHQARQARVVKLLIAVAEATHYGHQRQILHRDLKPANILLDAEGNPFVGDFGLAKRTDLLSSATLTGEVLGSPGYMSPEQWAGGTISTVSDVYSLGVILYRLLSGREPFEGDSLAQIFMDALKKEPPEPRQMNPAIDPTLQVICLHALRKEPEKRYPSAEAFAEDLRRYSAREPILGKPVGTRERVWLWSRRNKAFATALVGLVVVLLLAAIGGSVAALVIHRAQEELRRTESEVTRQLASQYLRDGVRLCEDGLLVEGLAQLYAGSQLTASPQQRASASRLIQAWRPALGEGLVHASTGRTFFVSRPDAGQLVSYSLSSAEVRRWALPSLQAQEPAVTLRHSVRHLAYAPRGSWLATVTAAGRVDLWHSDRGELVSELFPGKEEAVLGFSPKLVFSPKGDWLVTNSSSGKVRVWSADDWRLRHTLEATGPNAGPITVLNYTSDGAHLLVGHTGGAIDLWDLASGLLIESYRMPKEPVSVFQATVMGNLYTVAVDKGGALRVWEASLSVPRYASSLGTDVQSVLWRENTSLLAMITDDQGVHLFSLESDGNLVAAGSLRVPKAAPACLAFAIDPEELLVAYDDRRLRLWDIRSGTFTLLPFHTGHHVTQLGLFSSDAGGDQLIAGTAEGMLRHWDWAGLNGSDETLSVKAAALDFTGDQQAAWLCVEAQNGEYHLEKRAVNDLSKPADETLGMGLGLKGGGGVSFAEGAPVAMTSSGDKMVSIWDLKHQVPMGTLAHEQAVAHMALAADGRTAVTLDVAGRVRVCALERFRFVFDQVVQPNPALVALDPTGATLALAIPGEGVRLFALGRPDQPPDFLIHDAAILTMGFSPDGRYLFTGAMDHQGKWWDLQSKRLAFPPLRHDDAVSNYMFDSITQTLATLTSKNSLRFWDAITGLALGPARSLGMHAPWMTFQGLGGVPPRLLVGMERKGILSLQLPRGPMLDLEMLGESLERQTGLILGRSGLERRLDHDGWAIRRP